MLKTITALMIGASLVAGQAIAQNSTLTPRVGDRVGSQADMSSEIAGMPLSVLLIGSIVAVVAYKALDDNPASN
jgi:hypothetical protein